MTYIIVDFEATCCDKNTIPRHEMEIIEIGAVALDGNGPGILGEFQCFVRPVRNPFLTEFCINLTSIKQKMVESAESFPVALDQFKAWLDEFEKPVFCSWGDYDKKQLLQDCEFHCSQYPFGATYINIKNKFSNNMGYKKGVGLGRALKLVGLNFVGTAHRGIDDARNMASIARYIFL